MPADRSNTPPATPAHPAPRRRAWWKRILAVIGVLLLLLIIFHRPIVFGVARFAIKKVAAGQGLDVDLKLGGTLFTGLRVEDLRATPTRPGPIQKASVGRLEVSYSLPTLLRGGLNSPFLGDVVLHDADVVYNPSKSPPGPPKKKEAFKLPPLLLPDSLSVRNVNFQMLPAPEPIAKTKGARAAASSSVPAPVAPVVAGTTEAAVDQGLLIKGVDLELDPEHSGVLKIVQARIPGGPDLRDVTGKTSYRGRNLQITDLVLAPEVRFRSLGLDASKLDTQESVGISLDAELFRGTVGANILLKGTKAPPDASVQVDITDLPFAGLRDFLKFSLPLDGTLKTAAIRFDGNTDKPNTWTGRVDVGIDKPVIDKTALDAVNARLSLRGSTAELERIEILAGENRVALAFKAELPARMADLLRAEGRGNLKIAVPDLEKLPVEVSTPLAGSFNAGGDLVMGGGTARLSGFKGHVASLAAPAQRATVSALDLALDVSYALPVDATAPPATPNAPPPPSKPFWQGLATRVGITGEGIVFGDYKLDGVKLSVRTDEASARIETLEAARADNRLAVAATYLLPADFANWQQNPLAVQLDLNAPDVSQFSVDLAAAPLRGSAGAKGNVTLQDGNYQGGFDLQAKNLRARGAKVEAADIQVGIVNNQATVRSGTIRFDDKNRIGITGQAGLRAPYPFDAGLDIDLADLSRFEPVLAANNVDVGKFGGSLQIAGKASGHAATSPTANDRSVGGSLTVTGRALEGKGAKIDGIDTRIVVENNTAVIKTGEIRLNPKSTLSFGGQAGVQAPYNFKGSVKLDLPDLSSFQPILAANEIDEKISGSLVFNAQASGHLASAPGAGAQVIAGSVDLTGKDIRAQGAKIESIDGHIIADNDGAAIKTFVIRYDARNTIELAGQAATRAPFAYQGKLNVNLADLKSFEPILRAAKAKTPPPPAKVPRPGEKPDDGLVVGPEPQVLVDTSAARQGRAKAALEPAANRAAALASPRVSDPGARKDAARATFEKNSKAAKKAGIGDLPADTTRLAGAVQLQWEGKGNFARDEAGPQFSGSVRTALRQVEFNAVGPVQGDIAGTYAQQDINFPTLVVSSNGLEFRSTIRLADALARIDNISLKQGTLELLAGYIQLPLDLNKLSAPGGPVPDVDQIDVKVYSKPLSLQTLFASIDKKKPSPVRGTVELGVYARGSLSKIEAAVKVAARGLSSPDYKTIRPADADLLLALRDRKLTLDTSFRQPQLNTLTIKGNLPLDLNAIAEKKALDPNLPVNLTLSLPRSDLGFLSGVTPAIRFVQGTLGADVRVNGTVGKPTFAGSVDLNVPAARAANITVPSVRDFQARLAFTREQLRFERFTGELGGGRFDLSGRVDFIKLTEPVFALALTAKDVLAVRDDNLTARVNANLKVSGPLAAASVTGYVGLTKSRYLKDIDIVPLNLPGKPAPAPPPASQGEASIAITSAPLRDWKFDIDIRTDDPFFVRGNLANGQAGVDLHLRGTGAKPLLDGNVTVNNLTASLPFSRLEINNGNVLFSSDQPLNPTLNLTGISEIRNYIVTLIITGRAKDPKIVFTSEPPLPQEEIVSLLATGSTTDELTGSVQNLAGKATLLVLEDLYRRTFKKKGESANAKPRSTLSDRLTFDVGSVDPVTNRQELSTRYKITDQVQFFGDFGIQGDLRGRIKYLIRFR